MKKLFFGIVIILIVGFGGFFYRTAVERSPQKASCPVATRACPDGTVLTHTGLTCDFPACPPPNVTLGDLGITFAVPDGFSSRGAAMGGVVAGYEKEGPTELEPQSITIRQFPLTASTTALSVIQETAIGGASGLPVSSTLFSSITLGGRTFTVVPIERFEAVVQIAYYLTRPTDVLRFDATDRGVVDWMEPTLDVTSLPAQQALRQMLSTLQSD